MNTTQISTAIKILIAARDERGADVQPAIDSLFEQFQELNADSLSQPTAEMVAHSEAVASMG